MACTRYGVDTSVFARLAKPAVWAAFAPLAASGQVALCAPVAFDSDSPLAIRPTTGP